MLRGPEAPPYKYIACNADEMEPGSFKDRILMERNPHLLLEGMLIAAYATEATTGYIFIRGEYARVARVLERALDEARAAGYLGENVLGSGFSFRIFVHVSAGRYLCGEASAMLNALEGKRANPRARPPHMTGAGLWGEPTVVNNVETLCCAPSVMRFGAQWWLDQGAYRGGRQQAVHPRRAPEAAGVVGAPARHDHARDRRGACRRYAGGLRGASHHPRRRFVTVRRRRRLRRGHGL